MGEGKKNPRRGVWQEVEQVEKRGEIRLTGFRDSRVVDEEKNRTKMLPTYWRVIESKEATTMPETPVIARRSVS